MRRTIDANMLKAQFTGNFQKEYGIAQIKAIIDTMPTIEADTVRHGRWIKIKGTYYSSSEGKSGLVKKCSLCGEPSPCGYGTTYCAICGARMDGGECHDD